MKRDCFNCVSVFVYGGILECSAKQYREITNPENACRLHRFTNSESFEVKVLKRIEKLEKEVNKLKGSPVAPAGSYGGQGGE